MKDKGGARWLFGVLAAMALGGCATHAVFDPASPYARVPEGSQLIWNSTIEVPPGVARVFLQDGRVAPAYDHYRPNCNLEVRKIEAAAVQYVAPGRYRIGRVQPTLEETVQAASVRLAALGPMALAMGNNDGGTAMVYEGYHFWLEGPDPNLMRLSCRGALADPPEARPPSVKQIRQALGEWADLRIDGERD
jgi:hypothetical protein